MNFFQAQDQARRKTWQLGILFGAAVVTLVFFTNLLVALFFAWPDMQQGASFAQGVARIPTDTWFFISVGVIGLIGTACVYKFMTIRGGGRAVAEALGGHLIHQSTQVPQQRRLLNIVEEMAIAAGIAVPPVYLIPESSINAFAAGFSPDDAVMGINQGTLDLLNREELQGVVAHEFSHILNGDMRINLRLMAILHGILFLGMIGYGLMRAGGFSRRNGLPIVVMGLGLIAIGYGGTFFGNIIKSAVSRQREFLADASAVQFTRNPSGIADALKKIGGHVEGSQMRNEEAAQMSHMFFGSIKSLRGMFATHPPLDERIRAIEPNWNGQFPAVHAGASGQSHGYAAAGAMGFSAGGTQRETLVERVGQPDAAALAAAQQLIQETDTTLNHAAHDPFEAQALVYGLLIESESAELHLRAAQQSSQAHQLQLISATAGPAITDLVTAYLPRLARTGAVDKLALFEMAVPALKSMSRSQYQQFNQLATRLITSDGVVDVFEWVLHRLLVKEVRPHFEGPVKQHGRIGSFSKIASEAGTLLSILASIGHQDTTLAAEAFAAGCAELDIKTNFEHQHVFNYEEMNDALGRLRQLKPLLKPALLKACATTIEYDQISSDAEYALLQGIGATLDCPVPLLRAT